MKLVASNQKDVAFVWCPSPIVIDKRGSWGDSEDNFQKAPNGAFLKMASPNVVSHLVQPNEDKSAPIGWVKGSADGLYSKSDIWVDEQVLVPGTAKYVSTLDGDILYDVTVDSMLCCNDINGQPNLKDSWIQTVKELQKNYKM